MEFLHDNGRVSEDQLAYFVLNLQRDRTNFLLIMYRVADFAEEEGKVLSLYLIWIMELLHDNGRVTEQQSAGFIYGRSNVSISIIFP